MSLWIQILIGYALLEVLLILFFVWLFVVKTRREKSASCGWVVTALNQPSEKLVESWRARSVTNPSVYPDTATAYHEEFFSALEKILGRYKDVEVRMRVQMMGIAVVAGPYLVCRHLKRELKSRNLANMTLFKNAQAAADFYGQPHPDPVPPSAA